MNTPFALLNEGRKRPYYSNNNKLWNLFICRRLIRKAIFKLAHIIK